MAARKKSASTRALGRIQSGFDKGIQTIAPQWGYKRARSRAMTLAMEMGADRARRYDAAARGRRNSGWDRPGTSANSEIGPALHMLRAGSRELRRNNQWSDKAIRVRSDDIIGTGIRPIPMSSTGNKREELRIMQAWEDWAESTAIDPEGLLTFYAMQDLVMQSMDESGEVLIRRRFRRTSDGLPIPLQMQVIEADHLDTLRDGMFADNGNRLIQGIEYNRLGQRVAYWIFPDHPGELTHTMSLVSKRVPASEILHLFETLRPGQARGIPRGASCLVRTRDFDNFEDAVLMRQKLANLYVGFIHDIDSQVETSGTFKEKDIDEMEPGTYEHLPSGRAISFSNPPPAQGYPEYSKVSLRAISAGHGVTYEALSGDLTGVNFSSGRMGRLQYERSVAKIRGNLLVPVLCQRMWRWFVEAAVMAGVFRDAQARAKWMAPGKEMIDPLKEIKATGESIRCGLSTLSAEIRKSGRIPEEVLDEAAKDKAMVEERGLIFSCFEQPQEPEVEPVPDPDLEDDEESQAAAATKKKEEDGED